MIKPPVVYVAGMLRQTGTHITSDDWVWMLDQMGQRPFYPPNVSGWEQNEAWLSTSSLRMRFQAAASLLRDAIEDGEIPAQRTPEQALERSLAFAGKPWTSKATTLGARVVQPPQRRRQGRGVGGQALLARARARAAPGPARRPRRPGLLMPRGCSDWHGTHAALRRDAGRVVPIPAARARRARGVRARRRSLAARPARGRRRACCSPPTASPGSRRAACSRRPPPRRPTRRTPRSSSRSTSTAATTASTRSSRWRTRATRELRSRIGIDPATALPLVDDPNFGWHPEPGRAARAVRRRQGRRAARGRLRPPGPVALQLGRLLAQRDRGAGARPQRLARAHARRDRDARQPAAGHPRRLGPGCRR